MNKNAVGIIVAVLVIIGAVYLFTRTPNTNIQSSNASGRVVLSVSDAAIDMSLISEINMTISSIDLHNQTTNGWIIASGTPQTYNLLDLRAKNESQVFADFQMATGTYDMARLVVDKIVVITKAGVTTEAKLPSGELKINTTLVVKENATSSINFDFLADKSLHMTGNGGYIFAPVVRTLVRGDVNATVNSDKTVKIDGGHVETDKTHGMDINGDVKENFQLNATDTLDVVNGVIKIHSKSTEKSKKQN